LRALEREFGDFPGARWTVPAGGLYVWLTLDGVDTGPGGPLVPAALEAGVLYVPGEFGHVPDEAGRVPRNEIRLCFGVATADEVPEGIRRLPRRAGGSQSRGVGAHGPRPPRGCHNPGLQIAGVPRAAGPPVEAQH